MNKGFTLVELIAVIVILALLVIITTPAYTSISNSIKTRNYESKKNVIISETLKYVEKYLKSEFTAGTEKCFTVNYLIRSGIIRSDSDEKEVIINDIKNIEYTGEKIYLKVWYDTDNLKLRAEATNDKPFDSTNGCETNNTY